MQNTSVGKPGEVNSGEDPYPEARRYAHFLPAIRTFASFSVESGSCSRNPGSAVRLAAAEPITGQGRIESTMEVGPLKQSSQTPAPEDAGPPLPPSVHAPVWAQRVLLVAEVAIAIWAGILVMVLPWTRLWAQNPLLAGWPSLKYFLNQSFIRGMISGIGIIDLWIGVSDAVHYRDLG